MNNSISRDKLLMVFTRNPTLGKVKQRLAADIGDEAALKVYKELLNHTCKITRNLEVEKWIFFSEEIEEDTLWKEDVFTRKLQEGKDLGERMERAFIEGFKAGFKEVIIIGSDLYDLSESDLKMAFLVLEESEAVIGPATDGGYYLLGLKFLPSRVFREKAWGSDSVLPETLENLKDIQLTTLESRNDIDRLKDLLQFPDLTKIIK